MLKLKGDSLDWALSHALLKGDTDILPHAFEFQALKHNWDDVKKHLLDQDILGWSSRPPRATLPTTATAPGRRRYPALRRPQPTPRVTIAGVRT